MNLRSCRFLCFPRFVSGEMYRVSKDGVAKSFVRVSCTDGRGSNHQQRPVLTIIELHLKFNPARGTTQEYDVGLFVLQDGA